MLAADGPDKASQDGALWCLFRAQLAVLLGFLGSADSFAPTSRDDLRAFVLQSLAELQNEVDGQKALSLNLVVPVQAKVVWDQSCQHDAILTCESGCQYEVGDDDTAAAFAASPFQISDQYSFNVLGASGQKSDGKRPAQSSMTGEPGHSEKRLAVAVQGEEAAASSDSRARTATAGEVCFGFPFPAHHSVCEARRSINFSF